MKQRGFDFGRSRPNTLARIANDWDAMNFRNAKAFLTNPELCGGPDSFGIIWARMVIERIEGKQKG